MLRKATYTSFVLLTLLTLGVSFTGAHAQTQPVMLRDSEVQLSNLEKAVADARFARVNLPDIPYVGLKVGSPRPGNLLYRIGLRAEDVIVSLNGDTVTSPKTLPEALATEFAAGAVNLLVSRAGREFVITAKTYRDDDSQSEIETE